MTQHQRRFNEVTGVYRDCKWCAGKGCLQCEVEVSKEYKRQFPDGPKPIMAASFHDQESIERLKVFLSGLGVKAGKSS